MTDSFLRALDARAAAGSPAQFWLRDDDAVKPTAALDQLLACAPVPLTLAVIPAFAGAALADRLATAPRVTVALHGWAHVNHASPDQKKQELGDHRPAATVLAELAQGTAHLRALFGAQHAAVLVPPWNRISPAVVTGLPGIGIRALSVFGPAKPAPLPVINTHVDVIDWHGTRGGRDDAVLLDELTQAMDLGPPVGLLTHHLVHDAQVWRFLDRLFALTIGHPGCRWAGLPDLLD
ncbi:MAG: polysaccharide deacetylase family protein [Pseudomonadota bacterium]